MGTLIMRLPGLKTTIAQPANDENPKCPKKLRRQSTAHYLNSASVNKCKRKQFEICPRLAYNARGYAQLGEKFRPPAWPLQSVFFKAKIRKLSRITNAEWPSAIAQLRMSRCYASLCSRLNYFNGLIVFKKLRII